MSRKTDATSTPATPSTPAKARRTKDGERKPLAPVTPTPAPVSTPKAKVAKVDGPSAAGLPCLCGCGSPTQTPNARFLSGHDARLRKVVIEAGLAWSAVPDAARPFFLADRAKGNATAGLFLDSAETPRWLRDAKADRTRKAADDEIERRVAARLAELDAAKEATVAA